MEKKDYSNMKKKKKKFLSDIITSPLSSAPSAIKQGANSTVSSSHEYSQLLKLI